MQQMIEVRFHGRGGQGTKIAGRILGRSGFLAGLYVQDFSLFGAERRGAPVVACTRLSRDPIDRRGYVDEPDLVVVMDESLLQEARAQIFHGVDAQTPVLINTAAEDPGSFDSDLPAASFTCLDLDSLAHRLTGGRIVSAVAAAAAARITGLIPLDILTEAVRIELTEADRPGEIVEKNIAAARAAFDSAPPVVLRLRPSTLRPRKPSVEMPPLSDRLCAPIIRNPANAGLRRTGSWRVERPEIELAKCKRCFLCFLYCPETAIRLDADNFPHVDYEHCKGCMICYEECPTDAITRRLEA
jgi:pyruvate ferredoxin oxidoreductase gamma subunit